jgi:hypothetical protein
VQTPGKPAAAGQPAPTHPVVHHGLRMLALLSACMLAAHLLAGCGGGGDDPDVPTPTTSCTAGVCK